MRSQYGALVTTVDSARAAALESGYQAHVATPFDPAERARTVAHIRREHLSTS
jgi:CheY-like chemotaxis protein